MIDEKRGSRGDKEPDERRVEGREDSGGDGREEGEEEESWWEVGDWRQ